MKKSTNPSYLFLSLTVLSLICYIYLHKVAYKTIGHCPSASITLVSDESDTQTTGIFSPDIALVKRFLSITKTILRKE